MYSESELIEKLLKIESLHAGATSKGEKDAAKNAWDKIQIRLDEYKKIDPPIEWKLSTGSKFEKKLLNALLRRYGLMPYRYSRQKHTTVMVMASNEFMNNILWPEYTEMSELLRDHLHKLTTKIIKSAINENDSEEEIRDEVLQINYQ